MNACDTAALDAAGLNLHAVFDLGHLPADLVDRLDPNRRFRQLILIGHGGRRLWQAVTAAGLTGEHPIDDFSVRTARAWLADQRPGAAHAVLYPGDDAPGLQALGRLAGWHHDSPLMLGVHPQWGLWYAYRVVLLAATDFAPTPPEAGESPCAACAGRACVAACPADALADGALRLAACVAYRRRPDSRCRATCLARLACPVGAEHRYDEAQIRHTYVRSMRAIEERY